MKDKSKYVCYDDISLGDLITYPYQSKNTIIIDPTARQSNPRPHDLQSSTLTTAPTR